ncbi:MAG: calcium-binding protein, partial [Betaproteobacteria bacterium]|nr:calcium-binding protein [Betaproteobacteria bacterium]
TISYNWWGWSTAVNFTSAYKPGTSSYTQADPGGGTDTISNIERVDIQGGRGNDTITGDAGDNDIRGNQGADTLTGGGGNDRFSYDLNPNYTDNGSTVDLNQAADLITDFGQGDSIQIFNWNPSSLLASGSSSTLLAGQALVLSGSNGEVVLHVGADSVAGSDFSVRLKGAGNTSLNTNHFFLRNNNGWGEFVYGNTPQTLTGTEGNDTLNGGPAADSIAALGGNDRIEAFEGNDTIDAGAGDDNFIDAGPGNDLVRAGSGNDWVVLGGAFDGGSDTLDGGDGYDTVRYEYNRNGFNGSIQFTGTVSTGIQIDPQGGTDVISNVEELQVNAGSGNDLIIGDPVLRNWIAGNDGNDTIQGGASNDWLQGWSGADSIMGLGGNDYIQANANGNDANDTIDGGDGYDTISYNWWGWSTAVNFTSAYKPGTSSYTQADPG